MDGPKPLGLDLAVRGLQTPRVLPVSRPSRWDPYDFVDVTQRAASQHQVVADRFLLERADPQLGKGVNRRSKDITMLAVIRVAGRTTGAGRRSGAAVSATLIDVNWPPRRGHARARLRRRVGRASPYTHERRSGHQLRRWAYAHASPRPPGRAGDHDEHKLAGTVHCNQPIHRCRAVSRGDTPLVTRVVSNHSASASCWSCGHPSEPKP